MYLNFFCMDYFTNFKYQSLCIQINARSVKWMDSNTTVNFPLLHLSARRKEFIIICFCVCFSFNTFFILLLLPLLIRVPGILNYRWMVSYFFSLEVFSYYPFIVLQKINVHFCNGTNQHRICSAAAPFFLGKQISVQKKTIIFGML